MKKIKKFTIISILSLFALLITLITGTWVYHQMTVKNEITKTPPIGQLVEVNDHLMHVYTEGESNQTIVFMSGGGTSSPTLDFKPLWSALLPNYRIAVVEKAGYGWSETANVSRDIDFMLEETRAALKLAGEKPPYILAPHSMSGLEAIRWAQQHPEEVEAIVGLDPAIPEVYDVLEMPSQFIQSIAKFAADTGLLRLVPSAANSSAAIKSGNLSQEDETTYRALFYRGTLTSNMYDEAKVVKENATIVGDATVPLKTPMLFFISDGKEIGLDQWQTLLASYTEQLNHGEYINMDTGHYSHTYEPEKVAKEIHYFLNSLKTESDD